jgi:Fic family protein
MNPEEFRQSDSGKVIHTQHDYWAFVPNPLPPNIQWSLAVVSALSEADRDLSRLNTLAEALPFNQTLILPFIRQEAVLSSRIEGTRASLVDLYAYEAGQLSFFETVDDSNEVLNYVRALEYGLERVKTLPVSLRLIREIHARLMENVRGGQLTPGEFRRSQNWIGPAGSTLDTATYVPPPVDEMLDTLDAMEKFIHASSQIPPLVRAGFLHYQFEAIHPFLDGNGRMGRLLIILLLHEWHILSQPLLNLSVHFEAQRQEYYAHLLEVSKKGAWEKWLLFFLTGVSTQAVNDAVRLESLLSLRVDYLESIRVGRRQERLEQVLDLIFQRPILNVRQAEAALGIPYMTAERCIERLVEVRILREITGKARNRIYRADKILAMIEK